MPLAVTLKSACQNLDPEKQLRLHFLDGGVTDESWQKLKETLADDPIEFNLIKPDQQALADLKISHHISHTAYFRLLSAELLPGDISEAVYLDSDLFINDDIGKLWDMELAGQYCLASVDIACPFIDAARGCRNFRRAAPYMAVYRPIGNYQQLGLDGSAEYFNSGVLKLNLDLWRRENIAERLLQTLRDNEKYVWCWDQYALNVVFHGNWGRIHPKWNQGAHVFEYPTEHHAPIDVEEWSEMKTRPSIVHFTTEFKPWDYNSDHPRGELFYEGLAETAWRGWRPEPVRIGWKRWFDLQMAGLIRRAAISTRKVAAIWS